MRRKALMFVPAFALALVTGVLTGTVSYWRSVWVSAYTPRGMWVAGAGDGRLVFIWNASRTFEFTVPDFEVSRFSLWGGLRGWPGMGEARLPFAAEVVTEGEGDWAVVVSWWYAAAVLGVLPGWWLWGKVGGRGNANACKCRACSYDLTGNTSGVCPECGITIDHREGAVG